MRQIILNASLITPPTPALVRFLTPCITFECLVHVAPDHIHLAGFDLTKVADAVSYKWRISCSHNRVLVKDRLRLKSMIYNDVQITVPAFPVFSRRMLCLCYSLSMGLLEKIAFLVVDMLLRKVRESLNGRDNQTH